ncbi:Transcription initiation factor TFIID subunit 5 [Binucleata daphniae]
MSEQNMQRNALQPDDPSIISSFSALKTWVEDSLDLFRKELTQLLYPLFIHIYFDLINAQKPSEPFFNAFKNEFTHKKSELVLFESIKDVLHLRENALATSYRTTKYKMKMGKYAFDLFISYLEENSLTQILKLVSHHFDINVYIGAKKEESDGLTGTDIQNDAEINLQTSIVTRECEESILNDEKYKYDTLEAFVHQLKKQRDPNRVSFKPNASYIVSEIEKLKDICKRVSVNKNNLPSICCYTVFNAGDRLTCSEISDDTKFIALGYHDSVIEIHSLADPLMKLKSSAELGKTEEFYENIGHTAKLVGHSGPVYSIKFFTGNKSLISSSQDCTIRLWSLELFKCIAVYKSHVFPVWSVDVSIDNFYFASGSADRTACLWSITNSKPVRLYSSALSDVTVVRFHTNGNFVFAGSSDSKIRMHCNQDGALVRIFNGHNDGITCLAVSHCGKFLLSGSGDKSVILWDIQSGKSIYQYAGHTKVVYSVHFCYYGSVIASCGADNTVRLWDRSDAKGNCLGVYHTKNTPLFDVKFGYRNILSVVGPYSI